MPQAAEDCSILKAVIDTMERAGRLSEISDEAIREVKIYCDSQAHWKHWHPIQLDLGGDEFSRSALLDPRQS